MFIFYALAILLSAFHSDPPMASVFYLWQFGRMALCYYAVVKLCTYPTGSTEIVKGWAIGLGIQAAYTIQQHLAGDLQAAGTLGHQNTLGMVSNLVVLPAFALLLTRQRGWAWRAGPLFGLLVAIFTASRATIGLAGAGYATTYLLSAVHRWTPRKAKIGGAGLVVLAIATPLALQQLGRRAENLKLEEVYDERAAFEHAAWMMIGDHPFGVGANQYVNRANTDGYSARAGVAWNSGSRTANVHNSYLLVLAETGYIGLLAMVLFLATPIVFALRYAWRNKRDQRSELLIGLASALIIVSVHFKYEFAFVIYPVQYLLASNVGLIAGLSNQIAAAKRERRRQSPPSEPASPEGEEPRRTPELVDA